MKRSSCPAPHRVLLLAVAGVYLLPSVLGIVLQVAHSAEHALSGQTPVVEAGPGTVVHSHDGSTHSHGAAVAVLATALADDGSSDEEDDPEAVPPLVLLAARTEGHTPFVQPPSVDDPVPQPAAALLRAASRPLLRPPRG